MCFVAQTITQFTSWSRSMCRKSSLYLRLAEKLDGKTQIERLRLLQTILPLPLVVIKVSVLWCKSILSLWYIQRYFDVLCEVSTATTYVTFNHFLWLKTSLCKWDSRTFPGKNLSIGAKQATVHLIHNDCQKLKYLMKSSQIKPLKFITVLTTAL